MLTHPTEAGAGYAVRQDVGADGGVRMCGREVGVKLWTVPVGHL